MNDILVLPTGALADSSLATARSSVSRPIVDHSIRGEARFEVEGADLAAAVLRRHGVAERDIDRVWEAIALHASLGIAHRRGLLTSLTHRGVFIDAGRITDGVADRLRQAVLNAYPSASGDRSIADAIVAHASRSDAAAPPGSLAFELVRQHREAERARVRSREST